MGDPACELLAGKVACVTGGLNGIGQEIAYVFSAGGAIGTVIDIAGNPNDERVPPGWKFAKADVRDETALAGALAKAAADHGRLDIVVANAGLVPNWCAIPEIDLEEWDRVFSVNVRGVAATIKHAVPHMGAGGTIIAIASTSSWRARAGQCLYAATKHAVLGIVRSAAQDLGPRGIRVNAIGPGPIATPSMKGRIEKRKDFTGLDTHDALAQYGRATAMGRIATAAEVAHSAVFLASELSSGTTGILLPVECGWA